MLRALGAQGSAELPDLEGVRGDADVRPSGNGAGWVNDASGMGLEAFDKSATTTFRRRAVLSREICRDLYRHGGIAAKIIDIPIGDMCKTGWEAQGFEPELAMQLEESLRRLPVVTPAGFHTRGYLEAWRAAQTWADVQGGALLVLGLADGGDLDEVLDERRLVALQWAKVYDRTQIHIESWHGAEDGLLAGTPRIYRIWPGGLGAYRSNTAGSFTVHASRCQLFLGVQLDAEAAAEQEGFGDSRYQRMWDALEGLGAGRRNANSVLYELAVTVYKMAGVSGWLDHEKRAQISAMFGQRNFFKSRHRAVLLNKDGEDMDFKSPRLEGVDKLLRLHMEDVSSIADIPLTRLYGMSPGGMNATGESDLENYYSGLEARRARQLTPCLEHVLALALVASDGPTHGNIPEGWSVHLPALWEMSQTEQAQNDKTRAEEVTALVQQGVILREEARARLQATGYTLDNELFVASQNSGAGELSVKDRVLQIRLLYPTGALHLVEETATPLREMLGMAPWSKDARTQWLESHGAASGESQEDEG